MNTVSKVLPVMRVIRLMAIFMLLIPFAGWAQVDSTVSNNIFAKLKNYSKNHIVEKAYLHFDRPYYAAGDTMYFKAYVTLGNERQLSALSGVLHVELINNATNRILQSEKLEIASGVAWGDFALPDTLLKGSYRVRAYTRWMRNDPQDVFEQNIPVAAVRADKVYESGKAVNTKSASKPDIQFFPEGGNLITEARAKIAFKAIGGDGLGIAAEGEVVDNDNKQVTTFKTTNLGMGAFFFKPRQGKTYRIKVKYSNGTQDSVTFPKTDDTGIALAVKDDSANNITVKLTPGKTCYEQNKNKVYTLCVQSGDKLTYLIFKLDAPELTASVLKKDMHPGVNRITLFSPDGEPLNERLVFSQGGLLNLSVNSDKANYSKREKVIIKISALKSGNKSVAGDFSVSVTDEGKLPIDENNESTILSNLLLTSDLKGYVEQPNYYFSSKSPDVAQNLDNLMLTQGYRHFEWKKVLNDNDPAPAYQPEHLLTIAGTVKTAKGKPASKSEVSLALVKQLIARDTTTDRLGNFEFDDLNIADTAKLLLRVDGNKTIAINDAGYPDITPVYSIDTIIQKIKPEVAVAMQKRYEQNGNTKNGILLKQVDIKDQKNHLWEVPLTHSANLNGPGRANQVIMGDKLVACPNLADCLPSLLHGIKYRHMGGDTMLFYSMRTSVSLQAGKTRPMAVLLDGVIRDQLALREINSADVASIEVLLSREYLTIYGEKASGGLIIINTKRGDENNKVNVQPGLTTYTFNGFYKAREFYSPKYDAQTPANTKPDQRTTIYWQPVVLTDKDGNASFNYYNADGVGTYRVVVEGIDGEGNIGRQLYHYTVK